MALTPPPSAPPAAPTAPGEPPQRSNPSAFRVLADAFVGWLVTFRGDLAALRTWLASYITWASAHVTEMDALQADVTSKQSTASTAASTATTQAVNATSAAAAAVAARNETLALVPPVQVADYTALRAYAGVSLSVQVTAIVFAGTFTRDDADTTSADNGGTIIVAFNGKRWKRSYTGAMDIRWFNAKVDGTTDDLGALNSTTSALFAAGGGKLLIPKGYTRITGTWNIGAPEYNSHSFIVTRTVPLTDPDFAANTNSANHVSNQLLPSIDVEFEDGAFLVADFAPATPTPALAYNLPFIYNNVGGTLKNPTVISPAMLASGKYKYDAVATPQTNNIIGIFAAGGAKVIEKPFVSGCQFGLVQVNGFWSSIRDVFVARAGGRCLDLGRANAVQVENITMFDSAKGLVFDGAASKILGIHTEQVAEELTVFFAECCEFGPGYLEDVAISDGTGKYAVTLGTTANAAQIIASMFKGIRVGAARPNKGAYRIWALSNTNFEACRSYAKTITVDTASRGTISSCDFAESLPLAKFSTAGVWSALNPTGTNLLVYGPWLFTLLGIAPGSIAAGTTANYDYVLPASIDGMNNLSAFASYTSGGNALLKVGTRVLFTTPRKVRLEFSNTTAGAIDPGSFNMVLGVVAGV